jgi:hypothetical protein
MGKLNLADAAKAILSEDSKSTFSSNIAAKRSGQYKPEKLNPDVAYHTKDVGDIGTRVKKTSDEGPDPTKGVPTATPPGATPPVGSEPHHKLSPQPQETMGRRDLEDNEEAHEIEDEDYKERAARKPSRLVKQTMQSNPGAHFDDYTPNSVANEETEAHEKHEDEAEDKKMIKKMIKKEKMKEDMDALLSGENLSEEFVSKATTIFEAAVIARAEEVIEEAEEILMQQFEEAVEEVKEDLAAKIDDYLNYMVEEWMKDNEVAINKGLRAEIVEDFITGLKGLFEEHYIDIPEDKVNVVEELTDKVTDLEDALNEQIANAIELKKELNEHKKTEAIYTACEGLTQTQVEKMKSLAEGVEFTTEDEFGTKLSTLKESYFKSDVKVADQSALDEVLIEEEEKKSTSGDPMMDQYVKSISKTLIK